MSQKVERVRSRPDAQQAGPLEPLQSSALVRMRDDGLQPGDRGPTVHDDDARACERPNRLLVTWVYMDTGNPPDVSEVEVRLSPAGDERKTLELVHTAVVPDEMWDQFGPGAVGVGWDGGLLGLSLHLRGEASPEDREAWPLTDEGREFHRLSSEAWGEASRAAGVDPEVVARNVEATTAFYTTVPEAG